MTLGLIINFLAVIGALTLCIIALTLWAYFSDEEDDYDGRIISDDEVHELQRRTIPRLQEKEPTAT